jgi:DnaD/phage-associated family protein
VCGETKVSARLVMGTVNLEGGVRMSGSSMSHGELEYLQALIKRGFVNIPRLLFDYTADLGLDYDTIGKLLAVIYYVDGANESAFGQYRLSRTVATHDFDLVQHLLQELEQKDLVMIESETDPVIFSFTPLYSRLRVIYEEYREQYEEESGRGSVDPAILAAEKLLVTLSDRQVADIQDWVTTYGFGVDMVQAIIREGQRQGVTRMNYLNQIAKQWFEEGVRSPEEAEIHLQRYRKVAGKHKVIIQYLGLNRQLAPAEQALLDKWTEEWGFSNEVVISACTEAIGKRYPLQYINKILETWKSQGIKTVAEVEQSFIEHKRRAGSGEPPADGRSRKQPSRSNVFLQREKKGEKNYDHIYKRFDD